MLLRRVDFHSLLGAPERYVGLATFLVATIVYVPTASLTRVWNSDVQAAVVPAIAIARHGSPFLDGLDIAENPFFIEAGGHLVSNRPFGISALAVPAYLLAGAPNAIWPAAVTAALASALSVTLMHLALRRVVSARIAIAATAVFAFGTPTWSVSASDLWGHTGTQLSLAAAAFAASRANWWLVGIAIGLGAFARPHILVIAAVVGLGAGWTKRSWTPLISVGLPSATCLAIVTLVNGFLYGSPRISGYSSYVTENLTTADAWSIEDSLVNLSGFLISPDRGLFVWTPLALLLIPSVFRSLSSAPEWTRFLALGGVAYTLVQLRINWFHGVDTFYGYRHALELMTCMLPLYTYSFERSTSRSIRVSAGILATLQVVAFIVGSSKPQGSVDVYNVWNDNSFLFALREEPLIFAATITACLLSAPIVLRITKPHEGSRSQAELSDARNPILE